jgi:GntR family transcriptional regulator, transcriptional repressor for pyruvate dehydrogenase complex
VSSDAVTSRFAEPIRSPRTFEAAIDHIIDGIERARLRAGERLPNEADLAASLEISRPTLRQALRVLENSGLLDVRRGAAGGIFVVSDLIPTQSISSAVALEESHVLDVLSARRVLERAVTERAVQVASEDDYAEIHRTIVLLREHLGNRALVMRADAMFHRAVVRASHSRQLELSMRGIGRALAPIRDAYSGGLENDQHTLDVHVRQLAAMRDKDMAALEPILEEHFGMLEVMVAEALGRPREELFGSR